MKLYFNEEIKEMKEDLQNPRFKTSIYDTKQTRQPEYVKKTFQDALENKLITHVLNTVPYELTRTFGTRNIEKITDQENLYYTSTLYFDIYIHCSGGLNSRIKVVSVSRNNQDYLN